jgi:hypothetical protein
MPAQIAHFKMPGVRSADVRFGSKADICAATSHVRFTPNSDIDCVLIVFKPRCRPAVVLCFRQRVSRNDAAEILARPAVHEHHQCPATNKTRTNVGLPFISREQKGRSVARRVQKGNPLALGGRPVLFAHADTSKTRFSPSCRRRCVRIASRQKRRT